MIISEYVKIKISKRIYKQYKNLGYIFNLNDAIYILTKDINRCSKVKVIVRCDFCHSDKVIGYDKYNININKDGKYSCSVKCGDRYTKTCLDKYGVNFPQQSKEVRDKTRKTNLERYGVEYTTQSNEVKDKIKKTNLERYGVEYTTQSNEVKDSIKKTNLERYGVKSYTQSYEFKNKSKETCLTKYGHEFAQQSDIIKDKSKKSNLNKYGYEFAQQSDIIKDKIKKTNLDKYGVDNVLKYQPFKDKYKNSCLVKYGVGYYQQGEEHHSNTIIGNDVNYIQYLSNSISLFKCDIGHNFEISSNNYHQRTANNIPLCTICNPIGDSKSIKENDIFEYIRTIYSGEMIASYRDGLEIDIYLPELKIGFEFNGLYWHSDNFKEKSYHIDKTNYFKEKGIRIIHIWEDDWVFKQDIIRSQISNLLALNSYKIFARKCYIKEVGVKDTKQFLDNNHIQGHVNSSIKLGLYYQDELVSIMTFDSFEGRKKMEEGGYNLSRFCNKLGYNIIGGASKLLSHFIKKYNVKRIVSYADKDWSIGSLYYTLGFKNISENGPDYKYIVDKKRVHKSRYRKSKLKTNLTESSKMKELGINKIYDCGKIKFEYWCNKIIYKQKK